MQDQDKQFILLAIEKAKESVEQGGFPAGAIVVKDDQVIGDGVSIGNSLDDPTSHGETAAIRNACKNLKTTDLSVSTLYASMQPCLMCFGSAMWASISRIVYACPHNKVSAEYYGGHYSTESINKELLHPIEFVHIPELEEESLDVVKQWEENLK